MTTYKHVKERWEASFKTPVLSRSTIFNLVSKFEVAKNVSNAFKEGHPKTVFSPENKDIATAAFVHSPCIKRAVHFYNITLPYFA